MTGNVGDCHFFASEVLIHTPPGRGILISDIGISAMLFALVCCCYTWGWTSVVMYYFIPYMVRPLSPTRSFSN